MAPQTEACACGAIWPMGRLSIASSFPLHCPACRPDAWSTAILMRDPRPIGWVADREHVPAGETAACAPPPT